MSLPGDVQLDEDLDGLHITLVRGSWARRLLREGLHWGLLVVGLVTTPVVIVAVMGGMSGMPGGVSAWHLVVGLVGWLAVFYLLARLLAGWLQLLIPVIVEERISLTANGLRHTRADREERILISAITEVYIAEDDAGVVIDGRTGALTLATERSLLTRYWLVDTLRAHVSAWKERAGTEDEVPQTLAALRQTT